MSCSEAYGLLPCSTTLGGSISTMVIYGYCLLQGANLLSDGSEMLLEILDPGLIGGLVLPVLGALPDALIIVVSGLGGSAEEAQEQVAVGIGTLAGSTIMLLTIAWGGSLLVGRCDIERGRAVDRKLTHGTFDLVHTGVTTDKNTPLNAAIMSATVLLYLIIQIPAFFAGPLQPLASLIGGIVCLLALAGYCAHQVIYPDVQKRIIERARKRRLRLTVLKSLANTATPFGTLLLAEGGLNLDVADKLFDNFDKDNSNSIDAGELRALLLGLAINVAGSHVHDLDADVHYLMGEFDSDKDGSVSRSEFHAALLRLITERSKEVIQASQPGTPHNMSRPVSMPELLIDLPGEREPLMSSEDECDLKPPTLSALTTKFMQPKVGFGRRRDDGGSASGSLSNGSSSEEKPPSKARFLTTAIGKLVLGTGVCAIFSDPMVDAVSNFSGVSHIPPFFVAFCVTPLASNASELVSSLYFASRKHMKNISLTFCQVYGAATMNNTLCLGIFLLLVHVRGLRWEFTSEVIVIIGVTLIMGALGYSRRTFRSWMVLPNLALFPLAILVVYILDYKFHLH